MKVDRMIYQVDETRQTILEAAKRMFIKEGLFDTKMKDVADKINISRTSLYRYFRNKLDLSLAIFEVLIEDIRNLDDRIMNVCKDLPNGLNKIESMLKIRWLSPDKADTYRYLAEFDAVYSGSRISKKFARKLEDALGHQFHDKLLQQYITEGQKDGSVRTDIPLNIFAAILVNTVRAMHQRFIMRGKLLMELQGEDLDKTMDEFLKILINGIKKIDC